MHFDGSLLDNPCLPANQEKMNAQILEPELEPTPETQKHWQRMIMRLTARARINQRLLGQTAALVEASRQRPSTRHQLQHWWNQTSMPRNLWSLTVVELRERLRRAGLPSHGLKAVLIERLTVHLAPGSTPRTTTENEAPAPTPTPPTTRTTMADMQLPDTRPNLPELIEPMVPCPLATCGQPLLVRRAGHGGYFWGCPRFPQCRGTRQLQEGRRILQEQEVRVVAHAARWGTARAARDA